MNTSTSTSTKTKTIAALLFLGGGMAFASIPLFGNGLGTRTQVRATQQVSQERQVDALAPASRLTVSPVQEFRSVKKYIDASSCTNVVENGGAVVPTKVSSCGTVGSVCTVTRGKTYLGFCTADDEMYQLCQQSLLTGDITACEDTVHVNYYCSPVCEKGNVLCGTQMSALEAAQKAGATVQNACGEFVSTAIDSSL